MDEALSHTFAPDNRWNNDSDMGRMNQTLDTSSERSKREAKDSVNRNCFIRIVYPNFCHAH